VAKLQTDTEGRKLRLTVFLIEDGYQK